MFSWDKFYSEKDNLKPLSKPSSFALFTQSFINLSPLATIVDIGSGNGRDSTFFQSLGFECTAVDPSEEALLKSRTRIKVQATARQICEGPNEYDVVYMRFSLHSVDEECEDQLFAWARSSKLFCIETRSVYDPRYGEGEKVEEDAFSVNGHYRRFTRLDTLIGKALSHDFEVVHASVEFESAALPHDRAVVNRLILRGK